jgi:hypothetical protein
MAWCCMFALAVLGAGAFGDVLIYRLAYLIAWVFHEGRTPRR